MWTWFGSSMEPTTSDADGLSASTCPSRTPFRNCRNGTLAPLPGALDDAGQLVLGERVQARGAELRGHGPVGAVLLELLQQGRVAALGLDLGQGEPLAVAGLERGVDL